MKTTKPKRINGTWSRSGMGNWSHLDWLRRISEGVFKASKGRTLADMTEAEIQQLEREYGVPVRRPQPAKEEPIP